jgi:DNA polymerase bacteriophage-type
MGGVGAYRKFAPGDPSTDVEIKGYQTAWRKAHPATVSFWGSLNRAAIKAVRRPGETIRCNDRISFRCDDDFLRMKLPSGRELAHPFPRLHTNARGDCVVVFKDNKNNQWVDCRHGRDQEEGAHGGTWAENVVQAAARDLLAAAMQRIEAAGYPIVLHVHDEIVAEMPDGLGSPEEFLSIITELPAWAAGLPIAAKVRNGPRYCKVEPAKALSLSAMSIEEVSPESCEKPTVDPPKNRNSSSSR